VRKRTRRQAFATTTIGRIGPLRRAIIRAMGKRAEDLKALTPEALSVMSAEIQRMPAGVMARLLRGLADAPPRFGRQRRAAIVVCVDDPFTDPAALERAVAEVGIEPAHFHRLPSGGHHPHIETSEHPEWAARNCIDLVRIIDAMLVAAGETRSSSSDDVAMQSTQPAMSTTG
jgi:hypothetical protein